MTILKKVAAMLATVAILCTSITGTVFAANVQPAQAPVAVGEVRAVWVSFFDWQTYLKGKNQTDFTNAFSAMCDKILEQGCNTMIVHVRSHNDAVYPSAVYPWSTMMLNGNPGYDPLSIMVSTAHAKGLQFHAWINPYGYRNGAFSGDPALVTQNNIVAGVTEIVNNYAVDGIHFDDYFPPFGASVHNSMISQVYTATHAAGKVFGISPQGNIENNRAMGADIDTWLSVPGYIDYICPQIYWTDNYGASGGVKMYSNRLAQWKAINKLGIPMYAGLASYRCGQPIGADPGWGLSNTNLKSQANIAAANGYQGYFLYSYASLSNASAQTELMNLRSR